MTPAAAAYQVTDLVRNHRAVVQQARRGGALIRDKDGTALLLTLAADVARDNELRRVAADYLRLGITLDEVPGRRTVAAYGGFAWLVALEEKHQREFLEDLSSQLLVALSGGPLQPVVDLIEDWKATAATYADEELRDGLTKPLPRPLHNVEL